LKTEIIGVAAAAWLCAGAAFAQATPDANAIQNDIYQQMSSGSHGITVSIRHLHLDGADVVGDVKVHWEESIFGNRIVLIHGDYPFHTPATELLYAKRVNLGFGTSIKVHLDASYQPVRQACIDLHAEFLGGHILEQRCTAVP
jgi:hypothetical protein